MQLALVEHVGETRQARGGVVDAARKLTAVADRFRPKLARTMMDAFLDARKRIDPVALQMLLAGGDRDSVERFMERPETVIDGALLRAAGATVMSEALMDVAEAGGNATRCDFGGPQTTDLVSKFVDAPDGTSKEWIKSHQKDYDSDLEFKKAADAITVLTQGGYGELRDAAMLIENPLYTPQVTTLARVQTGTIKDITSPLFNYKNYFKGQNVVDSNVSVQDAAKTLNTLIDSSPRLSQPIYRGITLDWEAAEKIEKLVEGDAFDVKGISSFTSDRTIAEKFAHGKGPGQYKNTGPSVVLEVRDARGISVGPLSPWKQKEVISKGDYVVEAVNFDRSTSTFNLRLRQK